MNHLISRVPDKPCAYPISAAGAGAEREFTLGNTARPNIPTKEERCLATIGTYGSSRGFRKHLSLPPDGSSRLMCPGATRGAI